MIAGVNGPVVLLSAKTAHYLEKAGKLAALRARARGRDEQLDRELLELRQVAMSYRLPQVAEVEAGYAEVAGDLEQQFLSVIETADLVGLTDRAVRLACQEGRLEARQVRGHRTPWRICKADAERFRRERA